MAGSGCRGTATAFVRGVCAGNTIEEGDIIMRSTKYLALAFGLLMAAGTAARANDLEYVLKCPLRSHFGFSVDGKMSVAFDFKDFNYPVALYPSGFRVGGGMYPLEQKDIALYRPAIDVFTAAAAAKRRMRVYYNKTTKKVVEMYVDWDVPC